MGIPHMLCAPLCEAEGNVCTAGAPVYSQRGSPPSTHVTVLPVLQGSAADVAMAAMIRIQNDPQLAELGYRLLLQVRAALPCAGTRAPP